MDQYRIAVKSGILKGLYSSDQFDLCPQKLLTLNLVKQKQSISLRTAVIAESTQEVKALPNATAKVARNDRLIDANALNLGYNVIAGIIVA